jgi:hypothetical protein
LLRFTVYCCFTIRSTACLPDQAAGRAQGRVVGIDALVLALVAKALHFAYSRVGEDSAKDMLRNAVEEAISSIEELDFRPPH